MTTSTSLLRADPQPAARPGGARGLPGQPGGLPRLVRRLLPDDVKDALELIRDQDDDGDSNSRDSGHTVHVAPPSDPPEPRDGETEHEAAVRYLNTYVTNNYIDDRDTIVDNSVNQQIDTGGGDFDQDIDIDSNVASGDGAVAAATTSGLRRRDRRRQRGRRRQRHRRRQHRRRRQPGRRPATTTPPRSARATPTASTSAATSPSATAAALAVGGDADGRQLRQLDQRLGQRRHRQLGRTTRSTTTRDRHRGLVPGQLATTPTTSDHSDNNDDSTVTTTDDPSRTT